MYGVVVLGRGHVGGEARHFTVVNDGEFAGGVGGQYVAEVVGQLVNAVVGVGGVHLRDGRWVIGEKLDVGGMHAEARRAVDVAFGLTAAVFGSLQIRTYLTVHHLQAKYIFQTNISYPLWGGIYGSLRSSNSARSSILENANHFLPRSLSEAPK